MSTITDDLDIARQSLQETDDFTSEEIIFRDAEVSVSASEGNIFATMAVEGEPLRLSDLAVKQLATELSIPANYLTKCNAELQASNIDYWQGKLSEKKRIRALIGQQTVQAITSPNFIPIRNTRLFDVMVDVVGGSSPDAVKLDVFEHSWENTRVGLTNANSERAIQNHYLRELHEGAQIGDVLRTGANFNNSLTVANQTEIEPMAFRLICLNRMVTPLMGSELPRFRYKNDGSKPSEDWLRDAMDAIGEQYEPMFDAMEAAANTRLENPEQVIRDQLSHVPGPVREAVINAYREEPMPTQWGVVNAFTRAATHADDLDMRYRIATERHGGWFAVAQDVCDTCGRANGHSRH